MRPAPSHQTSSPARLLPGRGHAREGVLASLSAPGHETGRRPHSATQKSPSGENARWPPSLGRRQRLRRRHERTDHPEQREEDPEKEHPPVSVSERHEPEREAHEQVQTDAADSNCPPHDSSYLLAGREPTREAW